MHWNDGFNTNDFWWGAILCRVWCKRVDCKFGIDYHSFVLCKVLALCLSSQAKNENGDSNFCTSCLESIITILSSTKIITLACALQSDTLANCKTWRIHDVLKPPLPPFHSTQPIAPHKHITHQRLVQSYNNTQARVTPKIALQQNQVFVAQPSSTAKILATLKTLAANPLFFTYYLEYSWIGYVIGNT